MFSSLEEKDRETVIERCYWPLLRLSEKGVKIGIEMTGLTLEFINAIDLNWVQKFISLLASNKIELIGSGYAQIIGPLVPAEVNDWNQKLGINVYQKILGVTPKIALINEMAYSAGIVEHYINNGYGAIVMEWNNPRKYHPEWNNEWRYFPQYAISSDDKRIPLIWADSIAFQKFQRYAHGEVELNEYITYIQSHDSNSLRYFPLYANDVEIFNFRPDRYNTEADLDKLNEWERIFELYEHLKFKDNIKFISPSEVLQGLSKHEGGNEISLESPEQPIPVKKQEKYNINRWALTGRDDLWLNTTCYRLYSKIMELNEEKYWNKLCYFWSSDFRTHITKQRWDRLVEEIMVVENEIIEHRGVRKPSVDKPKIKNNSLLNISQKHKYITIQNSYQELILNVSKGCVIHSFKTPEFKESLMGTLEHEYFDDIEYGMDFFSGHAVVEQLGKHKITDLSKCKPKILKSGNTCTIHTDYTIDQINFEKTITVKKNKIVLSKKMTLPLRDRQIIHTFHFTFNPAVWDQQSLFFATHNGGNELEVFYINDKDFHHGKNLSFLISAKHGLGNTRGIVVIGDRSKNITFNIDQTKSFLIPSILFKKMGGDKFLFRLVYSAQEIDETFKLKEKPFSIFSKVIIQM